MSKMFRKQVRLHKRQQRLLKRLAQARGVSEAEIVRQALDQEATVRNRLELPYDRTAWERILKTVEARKTLTGSPYTWNRDEAYTNQNA